MGVPYKLLLVRDSFDKHIVRLISHLKSINQECIVDLLVCEQQGPMPEEIESAVREVYTYSRKCCGLVDRIKPLRHIYLIFELRKSFKRIMAQCYYDVINIHYPYWEMAFSSDLVSQIAKKSLVSPWGSDVYRITSWQRRILFRLYNKADNISGIQNRFTEDVKRYFHVPQEKIVNLNIGSDTVDIILDKRDVVSDADAKAFWGISGRYAITCGYNGSAAQRHSEIIDAFYSVKAAMPENTVLVFPMTYKADENYINTLKNKANDYGINTLFVCRYLSLEEMFMLIQASDMFVHVQITDADSATIKEYLLCRKKVLNGSWLYYDDLMAFKPIPFFPVENMDCLGDTIKKAYNSESILMSDQTEDLLKKFSWKYAIGDWDKFYSTIVDNGTEATGC